MIVLPDQAYLPGLTPRPPEGRYDALKQVDTPLHCSLAWRAGLVFFAHDCFWEAHEVWEAVWMAAPEKSPEKCAVAGAIQLANARLKARMGRARAAQRLEARAEDLLQEACRRAPELVMGLCGPVVQEDMQYIAHFGNILRQEGMKLG